MKISLNRLLVLIRIALRWARDPVIFVTFFAPWVIQQALLIVRDQMRLGIVEAQLKGFQEMLIDPASYALVDFSVQLYTAFLGWIFLCFKLASSYAHVFSEKSEHANGDTNRAETFGALLLFLVLILGVLTFVFGVYWNIDVLQLYLEEDITQGIGLPPPQSPVTWARAGIFILGVVAMILARKKAATP